MEIATLGLSVRPTLWGLTIKNYAGEGSVNVERTSRASDLVRRHEGLGAEAFQTSELESLASKIERAWRQYCKIERTRASDLVRRHEGLGFEAFQTNELESLANKLERAPRPTMKILLQKSKWTRASDLVRRHEGLGSEAFQTDELELADIGDSFGTNKGNK